jgi:murein DD-endopeptidase MepM/ murein hydrolase activator NlpD
VAGTVVWTVTWLVILIGVKQGLFVFGTKDAEFFASTGSGSIKLADAISAPLRQKSQPTWREKIAALDLVPDLGENIGSARWFRGLGSLTLLSVLALALLPDFGPLYGAQASLPTQAEFEEARAQMIMPLALGADSGRRMAANDSVIALAASPERPTIELTATLGRGDSFTRVLQRSGVGGGEAANVATLVSGAASLGDITPGTPVEIILGSRTSRDAPRPLQSLAFRARFDLNLAVNRVGNGLQLKRQPIAVDTTPLRIRGIVGSSLYRSARAAGAPAEAIQNFLKIIAGQTSLSGIRPDDEYDIIVDYKRAATGEVQVGDLMYAGIDRGGQSKLQMLKWTTGDSTQWFEASGVGQTSGSIGRPSNGHITSTFGMRRHPILGYVRMHSGVDFGAPYGSPIYAVSDGVVVFAGHKGGYGNFVQIDHGGGLATGYGHMSRFATSGGQHVRRGQIIGYIGSSGLSTGPHLHYELYRGGHAIDPMSVKFMQRAQLSGADLVNFRSRLNRLKSVKPGSALGPMQQARGTNTQPKREIDRLG